MRKKKNFKKNKEEKKLSERTGAYTRVCAYAPTNYNEIVFLNLRISKPVLESAPAPDNSRPERRRMVGTRTTARDWQWVDEMLGDDDSTPRRARRMPEGGGRRGGRRGGRAGGRSDPAHGGASSSQSPSMQPHGGASSSQAHQDFLMGLNSPRFQRTLQQIMSGDTMFMTYAGTPPSTYMQEPYVVAPEIVPDLASDDPTVHDRDGDEGAVPMGRGRRVHRCRGCGTGGHM
ncbi:hypothetical protein PIB30_091931 [Stylosanthes scabra]|uniref:Uncharacterized protein n=1 Tax=Stylosanthes scabra TaxID=79078 RepID=A0ABU6XUJ2_9FABA|nr:hypothetical protein [Stylosanthes scabra]